MFRPSFLLSFLITHFLGNAYCSSNTLSLFIVMTHTSLPKLVVKSTSLQHNCRSLLSLCKSHNVSLAAVTKCFCADLRIAQVFFESGITTFADSRLSNLSKLRNHFSDNVSLLMLRLPMLSEVPNLVQVANMSLNSELKTIKAINNAALSLNKKHGVILMLDLGDRREGVDPDSAISIVEEVLKLSNINFMGIGVNLTCFGAVRPTKTNLNKLVQVANNVKNTFNIDFPIISGGGSTSLYLLEEESVPSITQLRVGEALLLGSDPATSLPLADCVSDAFTLHAEVIEVQSKPSLPEGELAVDAFGNVPVFEDRGRRRRAICSIGEQDVAVSGLTPLDQGVLVLGGSSDHLILDVEDSNHSIEVGTVLKFSCSYGALLRVFTSSYVNKEIV
ncbi:hypothetical protein RCL1_002622 [Eukaryota sp. TZLM3-RCL]